MSPESHTRSDIAIVGMSGRFPGAPTLEEYWQNLKDGIESRTINTDEDLANEGVSLKVRHPRHVLSGFLLPDIDLFDSAFFGINPREAETLDPQHRLFLECCWQALEDAGCDAERFDGTIGLYGGSTWCNYLLNNLFRNARVLKSIGHRQLVFGSVPDYMVTRAAYRLNLKGPACFVQTACSTSLVAVHMACQSLLTQECDLVLAGGVSVKVPHRVGYIYEEGGMESPDGRIRAFDANARGTVFGSGVGVVVLKRLADAIADGDTIRAIIRGTATNNDGSVKVGFTAPSVTGQAQVISQALANANVSPDEIDYIEAHGTGTELGDPIELAALTRAFAAGTTRRQYCAVGSVKPNIGHLDAAAGVSSLIKTILAMQHRRIPPTINFETLNPKIELEDSPFFINTTLREWTSNGHPRRAGVSSFGFGGTNAHVVLEEPPAPRAAEPSRSHQLLVLSARTPSALDAQCTQLATHLSRDRRVDLADVAHTLQTGRRQFAHRRAVVCESREDAIPALQGEPSRWVSTGRSESRDKRIVFLFPGQGAQYVRMGHGLYTAEPVFRDAVDECAGRLQPDLGFDIREALYPADAAAEDAAARLKQTGVTQAAVFTVEYALARLWMRWGIIPAAMAGHSIGEFVAATLSGVLTLEDALTLVALRGRLMEQMPAGAMLAVGVSEDRLRPMLEEGLWLAASNSPSLCVASGLEESIARLERRLADEGVDRRRLHTSHAFHSGLMEGAVAAFVEAVRGIRIGEPKIPYLSNVTGDWVTPQLVGDPAYWGRHIRETVRFSDNIGALAREGASAFLEVGPGNTLSTFVRQHTSPQDGHAVLSSLRHPQEEGSDVATLLNTLGRLWTAGAAVNWAGFYENEHRSRVPLPTYPFERTRHWIEPDKPTAAAARRARALVHGDDISQWFHTPAWTRVMPGILSTSAPAAWLLFADDAGIGAQVSEALRARGHRVTLVRPGSAFERYPGAGGDAAETCTIDPAAPDHYESLIRELFRDAQRPTRIVHLWSCDGGLDDVANPRLQDRGFYSLLHLAQAIGATGTTARMRLDIVTTGVQDVTGDERLVPDKATALGPARVIPLEFPNIVCRTIDLPLGEPTAAAVDALTTELSIDGDDATVAYRRGRRWVQGYEPVRIGSASAALAERLKAGGTYLITGGLGSIALAVAEHFAQGRRCNLVLTGRSGLPPRETWPAYLAERGAEDRVSRKIMAVQRLEEAGADVFVGDADVADAERMRQVVADAEARFGRIGGVIHSAGVAGGGVIQLKKRDVAAAVLTPKVAGTHVLGQLFADRRLDFFVLCSSLTSVLGGVGQVDYCGANAYLDAFAAAYAATTGTFTVSVNWSAWTEVGMAVETDMPESAKDSIRAHMLAAGLTNREGLEALDRILASARHAQLAVSSLDVQVLLDRMRETSDAESDAAASGDAAAARGTVASHGRPEMSTACVEPRTDTERRICAIWQDMLGVAPIGVNDNFFDLGGHSLLAVHVMRRVNEVLGSEVPVAKLYEGLTVAFLSQLIDARHAGDAAPRTEDEDSRERRREKARRQKEHQQRRLATPRR